MIDKRIITTPYAKDAWPPYVALACEAFSNQHLLIRGWQVVDDPLWQEVLRALEEPLMLFARLQQDELVADAMIADAGLAPWCPLDGRGHQPFVACTTEELVDRMVAALVEGGPYGGGLRPPSRLDRFRARITGMAAHGYEREELRAAAHDLLRQWHPQGGPSRAYHCRQAWCDLFLEVAWDFTFLTVDEETRTIGLLMITDTD